MKKYGLKQEYIDAICDCFNRYSSIKEVILYGSRAKGNHQRGSDIDLIIIDSGMTLQELLQLENRLDDLYLPYKIDISLRRHINNDALLSHIDRVGKLFYRRKSFSTVKERGCE